MIRANAIAFLRKWAWAIMVATSTLFFQANCFKFHFKEGCFVKSEMRVSYGRKRFATVQKLTSADNDNDCFDEAFIFVKGGSGGQGANTFKFGKGRQHHSPSGGSGGDGGSVILRADQNMNTLRAFRHRRSFAASTGIAGDVDYANGAKGEDLFVHVPVGTLIFDNDTNTHLGTISDVYTSLVVAKGGQGGKGNAHGLKIANSQGNKALSSPPQGGVKRNLRLELQLLADIGLVGLPNAGKSTLLEAVTNARPKIADYAFTTLVPNLGVCYVNNDDHSSSTSSTSQYSNGTPESSMILADIPGLIEDAHEGKGLGKKFLKHIERCAVILHIVSAVSSSIVSELDGSFEKNVEAVIADYLTVNQELLRYSPRLAEKAQIVVLNKIDRLASSSSFCTMEEKNKEMQEKVNLLILSLQKVVAHSRIMAVSALEGRDEASMQELIRRTWSFLNKVKSTSSSHENGL